MNVYLDIIIRNSAAKIQKTYEVPLHVGGDIKAEIVDTLSYYLPGERVVPLTGRKYCPLPLYPACVAGKKS